MGHRPQGATGPTCKHHHLLLQGLNPGAQLRAVERGQQLPTGKLRRYRYYTCFSRVRYGRSGCSAPRIDADLLDPAAIEALVGFYARTDLITTAIANEHQIRAQDAAQHAAELDSLTGRTAATQATIDRYLTAFENGTLDEAVCGRRVADLTAQLDQLNHRRTELTEAVALPQEPGQAEIERIHRHLADILHSGTLGQRKAVMETHIAEIRIDGDRLIPIYRIPADTFRTQVQVVGRTGLEPGAGTALDRYRRGDGGAGELWGQLSGLRAGPYVVPARSRSSHPVSTSMRRTPATSSVTAARRLFSSSSSQRPPRARNRTISSPIWS